ncbi:MAG: DNA repair protein RecN [Rhodospirillaceae bacterium]|nr:DNA repair protein RecN [Rhodospirillaceae bacterium]
MLASLSIRNIVLIDKLDIDFNEGLCVLTGETGAGKSILLDSLGLAIGARADTGLVRTYDDGERKSSITAIFDLPSEHQAFSLLAEVGIDVPEAGEPLILRRTLSANGPSRAYVNDQTVSAGILRAIGETLIEIEGQFASHGLLNPANHRDALDAFGKLGDLVETTREAWETWRAANRALAGAREEIDRIAAEGDYLRHVVAELEDMAPEAGEEETLSESRAVMMNAEKIADALNGALEVITGSKGLQSSLSKTMRPLERANEQAAGSLKPALEAMERTANEAAAAADLLLEALRSTDLDPAQLERLDERLFALRALARKHNTDVASLSKLRDEFAAKLERLDNADRNLTRLEEKAKAANDHFQTTANMLFEKRKKVASKLDNAINAELPNLRLEKALFATSVTKLSESEWSSHGIDRINFEVTTNPGQPAGPINKVASGGELARLLLALKVALSTSNRVSTLVFDEVDAGVGGATAASVAERLSRLSDGAQVLVVTHSPQVAARGARHFRVMKSVTRETNAENTITSVTQLSSEERREEIARMLAGATVTEEARAAADSLIAETAG